MVITTSLFPHLLSIVNSQTLNIVEKSTNELLIMYLKQLILSLLSNVKNNSFWS